MRFSAPRKINAALVAACALFILLRLPSLVEPHWYGDEGIYTVVAQQLSRGDLLYSEIWDHKPPGIFLIYLVAAIWSGLGLLGAKIFSLFAGLVTLVLADQIYHKLGGAQKYRQIFLLASAVLFGSTLLEGNIANAENFFIPLNLAALLIILNKRGRFSFGLAGMLLAAAFLIKFQALDIVPAVLYGLWHKRKKQSQGQLVWLLNGAALPMLFCLGYFAYQGNLSEFFAANLLFNLSYAATVPGQEETNVFLTLGKLLILSALILGLYHFVSKASWQVKLLSVWLATAVLIIYVPNRVYAHYLQQLVLPLLLLLSILASRLQLSLRTASLILLGGIVIYTITFTWYSNWGIFHWRYYRDGYSNLATGERDYSLYGTDYQSMLAARDFLVAHRDAKVYYWGNHPWAFYEAGKQPLTRYIVYHHVVGPRIAAERELLTDIRPDYVLVEEQYPLPFPPSPSWSISYIESPTK